MYLTLSRSSIRTIIVGFSFFMSSVMWAQVVTTDYAGNQLYYVNSTTKTSIGSTSPGTSPENLILAGEQLIYYTLYGSGQVGVFNPYARTNTFLASGLDHPEALAVVPGCKDILVTIQGTTSGKPGLARILIPGGQVTFVPLTFTPAGLAYDPNDQLFVADSTNNTVHQVDPSTGNILASLPSPLMSPNNQPDVPNNIAYDNFTEELFITSSVYGGIYEIPTNLAGYTFITSIPAPALGIISNGGGSLYAAGSDTYIYQYVISQSKLTQLTSVPGLNGLALVPGIGCPKSTSNCEGANMGLR